MERKRCIGEISKVALIEEKKKIMSDCLLDKEKIRYNQYIFRQKIDKTIENLT